MCTCAHGSGRVAHFGPESIHLPSPRTCVAIRRPKAWDFGLKLPFPRAVPDPAADSIKLTRNCSETEAAQDLCATLPSATIPAVGADLHIVVCKSSEQPHGVQTWQQDCYYADGLESCQ